MKSLVIILVMLLFAACQPIQNPAEITANRTPTKTRTASYNVTQTLMLLNEGPNQAQKHNLWVALIKDQSPFQAVQSRKIEPENYVIVTDEYGNQYAEFDLKDLQPGTSTQITISYEIAVNELSYDLANCSGELPNESNQPELHIESNNPQIISLAEELSASKQTVCAEVKAFYDYIGRNLVYSYNGQNWGAQAALGPMGADCTEYSSLLMALSRAKGIPARYVEGLLYLNSSQADFARQEHAWVEIYFPGSGWVPLDPTLGRSPLTKDQHFARYSPNHIIVTNGRNPSTLRGASYWSHLFWPGNSTTIRVQDGGWTITPIIT